jgi:multimeric flavodoxin WrbA
MNVLFLQGSPRREGNTATVMGWIEDEMTSRGHAVRHYDIAECVVEGCSECLACQSIDGEPGCTLEDDGPKLFQEMLDADLVVWGTPLFCWGFSAQAKALIDRTICLCKVRDVATPHYLMAGKPMALVATAAGPERGNMDLLAETFSRYAEYIHAVHAGRLFVERCTRPEELGLAVQTRARAFAQELEGCAAGAAGEGLVTS